jgi:hypothetical protein
MTTINVSEEVRDKVQIVTNWLEKQEFEKTGKPESYILNDGVEYLLKLIDVQELLEDLETINAKSSIVSTE